MAEARGFRNSLSCRVENKLKAIKLTARKIEKERVIVANHRMNERHSDGLSSGMVESVPDSTNIYIYIYLLISSMRGNHIVSYCN